MPMPEQQPCTPNRTMPVTEAIRKISDKTTVTRLFFPRPLVIKPLYHPQWVWTCSMPVMMNARLDNVWKTAQLCHTSWVEKCPATCSSKPEKAVKAKAMTKHQSITNSFFIVFH